MTLRSVPVPVPVPVLRRAALAVALGALAAGCTNSAGSDGRSTTAPAAVERETVSISSRTIISAARLSGTVVAQLGVSAVAPAGGSLRLDDLRQLAGQQVSEGQRLASVAIPCETTENEAPVADDATVTSTSAPCRGQVVHLDAPAAGRLTLAATVNRAVHRGDAALEVADGDDVAAVAPGGWRLRLPLGEDDQPARFTEAPPLAYALLPDTAEPVFQARFERLDYGEDGSVAVIAEPLDPPPLVRGAKVTVSFVTARREDVPALPLSAVRSTGNVGQVLVLASGRTKTKQVIVGPDDGSWIEVQGLSKSDRVVRYPLEGEVGDP